MVTIATTDLMGYAPFHVAKATGRLPEEGAALLGPVNAEERDRLLASGEASCTPMSLQSWVARRDLWPGSRVIAVLLGSRTGSAGVERLIVSRRICRKARLAEASITYVPGGLEHFYLAHFWRHLGIPWPPTDKRREAPTRGEMLRLFRTGQADAVITYRNAVDVEGVAGVWREMRGMPFDDPVFVSVLVAGANAIRDEPDGLRSVLRGWWSGLTLVRRAIRPGSRAVPEVESLVTAVYGRSWETVARELRGYRFLTARESDAIIAGTSSPSLEQRARTIADVWASVEVNCPDWDCGELESSLHADR